jgi:hypothetical protein
MRNRKTEESNGTTDQIQPRPAHESATSGQNHGGHLMEKDCEHCVVARQNFSSFPVECVFSTPKWIT